MTLTPSRMRYSVHVAGVLVGTAALVFHLDLDFTAKLLSYCAAYSVISKGGEVLLAKMAPTAPATP